MLLRPLPRLTCVALAVGGARASPVVVERVFPDPEPCGGYCGGVHDPDVYVEGGTYWRVGTGGDVAVATADDLRGPWVYRGALLGEGTGIVVDGGKQDVWAPNVFKLNDTFYCYYSVSSLGSQASQIGFATSNSLEIGSWTDHGTLNIPPSPSYNLIDPAIFQDTPQSPVHMTFGSYWDGIFSLRLPPEALAYNRNDAVPKKDAPPRTNASIHWNPTTTGTPPPSWPPPTPLIRNTSATPDVVEAAFMHAHAGTY